MMEASARPEAVTATVQVTVGFKASIYDAPAAVWLFELEMPRDDAEVIRNELESLVELSGHPYSISDKRGRTSWGADGGDFFNIALYVADAAAQGVVGTAVVSYACRLARKFRYPDSTGSGAISEAEAVERSKWIVATRYSNVADSIEELPTAVDHLEEFSAVADVEGNTWAVGLRDAQGNTYEVCLGIMEGVPVIRRIGRKVE